MKKTMMKLQSVKSRTQSAKYRYQSDHPWLIEFIIGIIHWTTTTMIIQHQKIILCEQSSNKYKAILNLILQLDVAYKILSFIIHAQSGSLISNIKYVCFVTILQTFWIYVTLATNTTSSSSSSSSSSGQLETNGYIEA